MLAGLVGIVGAITTLAVALLTHKLTRRREAEKMTRERLVSLLSETYSAAFQLFMMPASGYRNGELLQILSKYNELGAKIYFEDVELFDLLDDFDVVERRRHTVVTNENSTEEEVRRVEAAMSEAIDQLRSEFRDYIERRHPTPGSRRVLLIE